MLGRGDTPPAPLLTDDQILNRVTEYLAGQESWIRERYQNRFGNTAPVRRKGDGYECIGPDGNWVPTENPHHHQFSDIQLWREAALCAVSPHTLDCSWAKRGCAPADLDGSGLVDSSDQTLFNAKWDRFGPGAACGTANSGCEGADLDGNSVLNDDDRNYMPAAQGCRR